MDETAARVKPDRNSLLAIVDSMGWTMGSSVFLAVAGFGINLIIGNVYGDAGLGIYTMAASIHLFIGTIAGVGQPLALVKYTAAHIEAPDVTRQYYGASLSLGVGVGLVAGMVLFLLRGLIAQLFHMPDLAYYLIILSITIPVYQLNKIALARLAGQRKMRLYSCGLGLRYLLIIVLTVAGILWKRDQIAITIWALAAAELLLAVYSWFTTDLRKSVSFENVTERVHELFRFGSQVTLLRLVGEMGVRLDLFVTAYFLTQGEVGVYSAALMLANGFSVLPTAVLAVATPIMAETYAKKQFEALEKFVNKAMQCVNYALSIAAIVVTVFFAQIISVLYPHQPEFLAAQLPVGILMFGIIFRGTASAIASIYMSAGRPDVELRIAPITLVVNACVGITLASLGLNMAGIALGSFIGSVVTFTLYTGLISRYIGIIVRRFYLLVMPLLALLVVAMAIVLDPIVPRIYTTLCLTGLVMVVGARLFNFGDLLARLGRSFLETQQATRRI